MIGDNITITVVRVAQGTVRIGIEAPREMSVVRDDVINSNSVPNSNPVPNVSGDAATSTVPTNTP